MGLSDFFVRNRIENEKEKMPAAENAAGESSAAPAPLPVKIREKEVEGVDLIDTLLSGKEIVTTLGTKYGDFEFRFPSGGDQLLMAHRKADYLGGRPEQSFDRSRHYQFEMWATLDILVVSKPEKFAKMTSWADCPDQALAEDLYSRGSLFCSELRGKIRGDDKGELDRKG